MEDDALYKEFEKLKMMAIEQEAGETVKFSDFCKRFLFAHSNANSFFIKSYFLSSS